MAARRMTAFHVRGYIEEGTTTTPFDMVVQNKISRLHLCLDVLRYVPELILNSGELSHYCVDTLAANTKPISVSISTICLRSKTGWSE